MSSTTVTVDYVSGMRESSCSKGLIRVLFDKLDRVSNNLEGYFLFCLFGLAILALFLCRSSMQALPSSLFFFVFCCFTSPSWAGFYISINFYSGGPVLCISSDRDDRMGAKIKTQKNPWTKI